MGGKEKDENRNREMSQEGERRKIPMRCIIALTFQTHTNTSLGFSTHVDDVSLPFEHESSYLL